MVKQKILIFGYWENNLGDDLFLKIFTEHYPDAQIYILTKKIYKSIYSSKNIRIVTYDSFLYRVLSKVLRVFKLADFYYTFISKKVNTIVCLGGSLFIEANNWKRQIKNLDCTVKNCKNSFVIGSNFVPYHSREYLQMYHELFARMSSVCFRDKLSYNLFSDLSNTRFAPDVVLNLKYEEKGQPKLRFSDYYVISVIDFENREALRQYKELYEKKVAEIATEIIENGSNIVLMSFCDKEGDFDSILAIQSLLIIVYFQLLSLLKKIM